MPLKSWMRTAVDGNFVNSQKNVWQDTLEQVAQRREISVLGFQPVASQCPSQVVLVLAIVLLRVLIWCWRLSGPKHQVWLNEFKKCPPASSPMILWFHSRYEAYCGKQYEFNPPSTPVTPFRLPCLHLIKGCTDFITKKIIERCVMYIDAKPDFFVGGAS